MRIRLFVALILSNEILDKIIELRKSIYPNDKVIKWEPKEKLHLTMKFWEKVEEEIIPLIVSKLNDIISLHTKVVIDLTRFRVICKYSTPKILWIGVKETKELNQLYKNINCFMESIGFEEEKRKYKPHITLLRAKGKENITKLEILTRTEVDIQSTFVNEVALIKSDLYKTGSRYTKIKSFKLT